MWNTDEQQQQLSTTPQLAIVTPGRLLALIKKWRVGVNPMHINGFR
ncbi:hypothetical protein OK016_16100 [Vibrio chagasii]|nr:hypothetical protein [Vibrio chagasii]